MSQIPDNATAAAQASQGATSTRKKPRGRRLTKTQEAMLRYIAGETALHGGVCCTKRDLAEMLGRSVKTVDRGMAALRRDGFVEVEMRFGDDGGQIASEYRAVMTPH